MTADQTQYSGLVTACNAGIEIRGCTADRAGNSGSLGYLGRQLDACGALAFQSSQKAEDVFHGPASDCRILDDVNQSRPVRVTSLYISSCV